MNKWSDKIIDEALDEVLDEYWKMTPEELEERLNQPLTPLGMLLKQFNDETLEAFNEILAEERQLLYKEARRGKPKLD